jgi:glyoxylase-like metal-dependent hydrolase (beta-lactamase superfamily II)
VRLRVPGRIWDGLWLLGSEQSCVYLVEGEKESLIVSGGLSYLARDLVRQFESFRIDESRIKAVLILHAHFDHVGLVPFLRRRLPDLRIYASARAWEVLHSPKAIKIINTYSREVAKKRGREKVLDDYDLAWADDLEGTVVSEGDCIDLGEVSLRIYETPGHSSCGITAYMRKLKALFASDSAGIPYKDMIVTSASYDYDQYLDSLEKLKDLEVDYVCADHYGCVQGDEAGNFVKQTILAAKENRALMEKAYLRTRDVKVAAKEAIRLFYAENPDYIVTPEILQRVYEQMFKQIAHDLEGNS